jgi:hypothetical protein
MVLHQQTALLPPEDFCQNKDSNFTTKGELVMNRIQRNTIALLTVVFIFALSTCVFAQSITIKASASPKKGGSISPSGAVAAPNGDYMQFTITPNTGY